MDAGFQSPATPVILGPTASGKSKYAVRLALETDAEIISCDSMQVYQGLEIGTAQPTQEEQSQVPHHLIGMLPISSPYDVNRFLLACRECLRDIRARGRNAVIVGGTGLYAKALVYGHQLLPADAAIAAEMRKLAQTEEGQRQLREILMAAADGSPIPPDVLVNSRHLARAAEITRITGKPPWLLAPKDTAPSPEFRQLCILPDFEKLKEKIRIRTAQMLRNGWIEETQIAIRKGLLDTPTARQALGYRDIAAYLKGESPAHTTEELGVLLANRTIQYARRQYTWFRHQHPGAEFSEDFP